MPLVKEVSLMSSEVAVRMNSIQCDERCNIPEMQRNDNVNSFAT